MIKKSMGIIMELVFADTASEEGVGANKKALAPFLIQGLFQQLLLTVLTPLLFTAHPA